MLDLLYQLILIVQIKGTCIIIITGRRIVFDPTYFPELESTIILKKIGRMASNLAYGNFSSTMFKLEYGLFRGFLKCICICPKEIWGGVFDSCFEGLHMIIPTSLRRRYKNSTQIFKIENLVSYFNKIKMNPFGIIFLSHIKYRRGYNSSNRIIKIKIFK